MTKEGEFSKMVKDLLPVAGLSVAIIVAIAVVGRIYLEKNNVNSYYQGY